MELTAYLIIFALGAAVGSFLNVVILRWNTGLSLGGRSFCFSCGKTLRPHELIPIASFLFARGRCRRCRAKISWQYPLIELLTGLIFLAVFAQGLPILSAYLYIFVFALLLIISVYDTKHTIIPDRLVYLFIALSLVRLLATPFMPGD